jgi:CRP/FNR family cyclic AMP-dependent transcriptional regulator
MPQPDPVVRPDELMTVERVAVLQRVGLFAGVPGRELVAVARLLEEVRVEPETTFIERGQVEDWMFVVARGELDVHIDGTTIATATVGNVVGELAVLAPGPRSASVTTRAPTLLLRLRREPFLELLDDHPGISRTLLITLARKLQTNADDFARPR